MKLRIVLIFALLCAVVQGARADFSETIGIGKPQGRRTISGEHFDLEADVRLNITGGPSPAARLQTDPDVNAFLKSRGREIITKVELSFCSEYQAKCFIWGSRDGDGCYRRGNVCTIPNVNSNQLKIATRDWRSMYFYSITVYYTDGYAIHYDGNGNTGGTVPEDANKYYDQDLRLSSNVLTRLGYTHDGWATSPGGEKVYDFGDIYKENVVLTLYAHWTLNSMTVENEISSSEDWFIFCKQIEGGKTYSGQTVRLMQDLHTGVNAQAGSYAKKADDCRPFSGIFDGQGHTITAAIDDTGRSGTALFSCINGATIKNLTVAGSINGKRHAAAIVGFADGTGNRIEDCVVTASVNGSGYVGGLVGHVLTSDIDISGCVFSGMLRPDVKGVFIGWGDNGGTKNVTNCLFLMQNGQDLGGLDLVQGSGTVNVTRCYKTANAGSYGSLVTAVMPYNSVFKLVTAVDGKTYYMQSTVSGVESAYEYTGSVIQIVPTLTGDGQVLTEGTDYTYAINPSTVQEQGDYTLTVNGMGDYTGTKTLAFSVTGLTFVNAETTTMTTGKYLVNKDVTINERITVSGDVVLNLGEGAKLSSKKGIEVSEGNRLTINGPGSLHIQGCDIEKSGIGAVEVGEIIINGGNVEVYGSLYGAAIGGDRNNTKGGRIIINGGVVKGSATTAAAFGGGSTTKSDGIYGVCGDVVINGGQVDAGRYNLNIGIGPGYELYEPYHNSGTLTLSWTNPDDYIKCGRIVTFRKSTLNSITFADGKMFILEGTNTIATATNIANQTLVPAAVFFDKDDNSTMLSDCEGKPLSALLADRTLYKDGKWNTLCLPFNVKLADSPLEGATARPLTAASITGTTLNLTFGDAVDELVAGTPYLIKWTKAADYVDDDAHNIVNPVFKGATIDAADNSFDNGEGGDMRVRFLGTYKSTEFNAEDKSVLLMGGSNNLYYPNTGAGIGAQRAYFKIGDGDVLLTRGITNFNIDFGDGETATGIISIGQMDNLQSDNSKNAGAWYSIDGRKVANGPLSPRGRFTLEEKPTAKGLYINNGKKILIK